MEFRDEEDIIGRYAKKGTAVVLSFWLISLLESAYADLGFTVIPAHVGRKVDSKWVRRSNAALFPRQKIPEDLLGEVDGEEAD